MSDGGSVLPQAEIDALFKQATGMSISPPARPASKADSPALTPAVETEEAAPQAAAPPPAAPSPPAVETSPAESTSQQAEPPAAPPPPQPEKSFASPAPVRPVPVRQDHPPAETDSLLLDIQMTLDDLTRRLSKVESSINQVNKRMRERPDTSAETEQFAEKISDMSRDLRKVNSQVNGIQRGLSGTLGYNVRDEFNCSSCGAQGLIAVPMKCSQCGEEGWWGWWPNE